MRKLTWILTAAVALGTSGAFAQTNNGNPVPQFAAPAQSLARVAALIAPFANVIRSKNVVSVSNPSTGIYCITPTADLHMGRITPSVSVEWGWSNGNDLLAFYRSSDGFVTDCAAPTIEVRTYDLAGNLSDRVAFTFVVD